MKGRLREGPSFFFAAFFQRRDLTGRAPFLDDDAAAGEAGDAGFALEIVAEAGEGREESKHEDAAGSEEEEVAAEGGAFVFAGDEAVPVGGRSASVEKWNTSGRAGGVRYESSFFRNDF
jgi:hypothetical protein